MNRFAQYAILLVIAGIVGLIISQMVASRPMGKQEVEQIVHDYLLNNPNVMVESLQRLQQQGGAAAAAPGGIAGNVQALKERKQDIFFDPSSPVLGNPKGDISLVEFFDYQCGYCKHMMPIIAQLLQEDKNLRVVMKEYPIFPGSDAMAKAALAVYRLDKDKYFDYHRKLMDLHEEPKEEALLKAAGELGIDTAALKAEMEKPEVTDILRKNHELGDALGVQGTPNFFLEQERIPGALGLEDLKAKIAAARKGKK